MPLFNTPMGTTWQGVSGQPTECQCCHERPPVRYQSMCRECLAIGLEEMRPDDATDKMDGDLDFQSNT